MSGPILATKLYIPPSRPTSSVVPRPRLIERLNEGLHHKLTLLSAPAGFGKTTLVSSWLNDLRLDAAKESQTVNRVAWLSLDEGDSELPRFLSYTIAALQTIDADLGQTVLPLLQLSAPPAVERLMTLLINDIAALEHRLILVLDDYHLIQDLDVHNALAFLLDRLPPQLHLVILSQTDPPFPLARLRVRGQINEIRSHDLQFSLEEATRFLNQTMGLDLQPEAIAALEQRTEGWIAGLQMAAIALQAYLARPDPANPAEFVEAFAGDDRYVVDYLIAEVLDLQPPHVLDFLQQTSILKRFTAALCRAVTDQANAGEILTYLEEANLFLVALDNRREWYRYHHLFGDLLYHRLKQTNPDQLSHLHRRASRWYQAQGLTDDAIHHALAGEAYGDAADLIEQVGLAMVGQARLKRLHRWIASLPERVIANHPYLSVLLAWISVLNRQPDQAESQLAVAESAAQNMADNSTFKSEIACQMAMLRGYVARLRYDLLTSIAHIEQAIQSLPDGNEFLQCTAYLNLGGNYWVLGRFAAVIAPLRKAVTFLKFPDTTYPALAAASFLTNTYLQRGQLGQAAKLCRQVEQELAHHRRPPPALAYVAVEQSALLYEQNELTAATDSLAQAIQLLPDGNEFLQCTAYLNLGGNYWILGRFAAVIAPLQKAVTFLKFPDTTYPALAAAGYLTNAYLQQGQLGQAAKLCRQVEQELAHHRRPPPALAYVAVEQGALLYEQNELTAATDSLAQAIQLGENLDRIVNVGRALLVLAWIKQVTGQPDEANALLERASGNRPPSVAEFDFYQVRLWLAQGNLEAAAQWARAFERQRHGEKPWQALNELTLAHVLLAEKQLEPALDLLSQCETSAQAAGITGWLIRSLALKALCYQAQDDVEQALAALQQALSLAEPEGYRRTFIDHGPPMQQLLQQAHTRGIAPDYVTQLLTTFPAEEQGGNGAREQRASSSPPHPSTSAPPPLVESLNERELSVLRLMAAGLSNREIAEELYLSVNTIKWYASNIYGKLNVNKRAEAVDRAHALRIL